MIIIMQLIALIGLILQRYGLILINKIHEKRTCDLICAVLADKL